MAEIQLVSLQLELLTEAKCENFFLSEPSCQRQVHTKCQTIKVVSFDTPLQT